LSIDPFKVKISDGNPVYTIITDAFETVTNGMHNPEAMQKLEEIRDVEGAAPWVDVIHAVRAFYLQDHQELATRLERVPDESAAGKLKPVLYHMSGAAGSEIQLNKAEENLSKVVTEESRFISDAAGQLIESVGYGEAVFTETASLVIKEIRKDNFQAAERLALWCLNTCFKNGFDEEPLADNLMMMFGQGEGLRLIGLALIEMDPESSVICFIRALIKKIVDSGLKKEEITAWLDIIEALLSACPENSPVFLDMNELSTMLESELYAYFGLIKDPLRCSDPVKRIQLLKKITGSETRDRNSENEFFTAAPESKQKAVQLELFQE
jgi:hypothetical protein